MKIGAEASLFDNGEHSWPRPVSIMTTVALATTHDRSELVADIGVSDLSAVSAQAVPGGVEIVVAH